LNLARMVPLREAFPQADQRAIRGNAPLLQVTVSVIGRSGRAVMLLSSTRRSCRRQTPTPTSASRHDYRTPGAPVQAPGARGG
jgi:hypothetical protein